MLVREATFTVNLGENGYLIGFDDDYDWPKEMPFGWRCGPATDTNAVVLPTTDTGSMEMTIQVHDVPPAPEVGGDWESAEEISLRAGFPVLCLAVIRQSDFWDAWPDQEPPLEIPPSANGEEWVRMRLYCHADNSEPGIGDRGERHLVQLWRAPQAPGVHPELTDADRQARAEYAAQMGVPVEEYTTTYPVSYTADNPPA
ncbi:hypothetical protein N8I84_42115 (plasmid) [Streptomyces cynarae]|uniref:Uncharacterized protein n=1 Tax=Streptomyces cynarae TaxID=2981134 RepID=A0ABY6EE44_9ACTN|nr:hypothetical protein [Streptomyces cynarae]UXY25025.1 hypothetical protein N8I84_42115 [Streptomyces cynarae]